MLIATLNCHYFKEKNQYPIARKPSNTINQNCFKKWLSFPPPITPITHINSDT